VVLDPDCRYDWLSSAIIDRDEIKKAARRLDPEKLTSWSVTPAMNTPDYDDPAVIDTTPPASIHSRRQQIQW